jgi:hypothetical protein
MANYISVVTPTTEISLAPAISMNEYTLDMAIEAINTVEEHADECMDWAMFGVGGPS